MTPQTAYRAWKLSAICLSLAIIVWISFLLATKQVG